MRSGRNRTCVGVHRKEIAGSQLRFSRTGANEAGSYSELQSGDGLWKGRNDPLAYGRREGGKGTFQLTFWGGLFDCRAQRLAFPH